MSILKIMQENPLDKVHTEERMQSVLRGILDGIVKPELKRRDDAAGKSYYIDESGQMARVPNFLLFFPEKGEPEIFIDHEIFRRVGIEIEETYTPGTVSLEFGGKNIGPIAGDVKMTFSAATYTENAMKAKPESLKVKSIVIPPKYEGIPVYLVYFLPLQAPGASEIDTYIYDGIPTETEERILTEARASTLEYATQKNLMPVFERRKGDALALKREYCISVFAPANLTKELKPYWGLELQTGKTVGEYHQKALEWFCSLNKKDFEMALKLLSYAQAVRRHCDENPSENFQFWTDPENPEMMISYGVIDDSFYSYFLTKKAISQRQKGYTPKEKTELQKYLYDSQGRMEFDRVVIGKTHDGKKLLGVEKVRLYKYTPITSADSKKKYGRFSINTSVLSSIEDGGAFITIPLDLFEKIESTLSEMRKKDRSKWQNLRLNQYEDLPAKLYMSLKLAYNRKAAKKGRHTGNGAKERAAYAPVGISDTRLYQMFGCGGLTFDERVRASWSKRTGRDAVSDTEARAARLKIMDFLVEFAKKMGWINGSTLSKKTGKAFVFFLSVMHFDSARAHELWQ